MEISPAVQPPKVGDPITAKWAEDLAAAVNSCANPADRVGEVSSPFGKTAPATLPPAMDGAEGMPAPFDVRLVWNASTSANELYVALFDNTVWVVDEWQGKNHSVYPANRYLQSGSVAVDQNTRWAKLPGYVDGQTNYVFVWLSSDNAAAGTRSWDVVAQQNTNRPAWADEWRTPPFLVADVVPGTPAYRNRYGLHQYHRGLVWQFIPWMRGAKATHAENFCASLQTGEIWDSAGANSAALSFDGNGNATISGSVAASGVSVSSGGALEYHGDVYAPTTITDLNGNTHTVLAKQ